MILHVRMHVVCPMHAPRLAQRADPPIAKTLRALAVVCGVARLRTTSALLDTSTELTAERATGRAPLFTPRPKRIRPTFCATLPRWHGHC